MRSVTSLFFVTSYFLPMLLQAVKAQISADNSSIVCYCDAGIRCNFTTNTCTTDAENECFVRVNLITRASERLCGVSFISCDPAEQTQCCKTHTGCNKCLLPLNINYEECLNFSLPEGCNPKNCSNLLHVPVPTDFVSTLEWWAILMIILFPVTIMSAVLLAVICFCVYRKRYHQSQNVNKYRTPSQCTWESVPESFISESGMGGVSSGGWSGGGVRMMEAKTIVKEITLEEMIATGGFSELWKARRHGQVIAVKKYTKIDDKTCERERSIYTAGFLRHDNIALYYGADIFTPSYGRMELWLIMRFYEHGCLADYLIENTVPQTTVIRILKCIADALEYLHQPFNTYWGFNHGGIAHRDLKPRNILMKDKLGNCAITDFGLSLVKSDFLDGNDSIKIQVGTKRYMAPEILNCSIVSTELHSFCMADIYSYGLLMWEVLRRSEGEGEPSDYAVPYYEVLPPDPSIEQVRRVVVEQRIRPTLEGRWNVNKIYCYPSIIGLMKECWSGSPDGRPTATRIKLKLDSLGNLYHSYHSTVM